MREHKLFSWEEVKERMESIPLPSFDHHGKQVEAS